MRNTLLAVCAVLLLTGGLLSHPSGVLKGRVYDSNGNPLEKVQVEVVDTSMSAVTDSDGMFELEDVPEGHHVLSAVAAPYACGRAEVLVQAGETAEVLIVLRRGRGINGHVGLLGEAVRGVNVTAVAVDGDARETGQTDSEGFFEFAALPAGTYRVIAETSIGERTHVAAAETVVVTEDEFTEVYLDLQPPGIDGAVL